MKHILALVLMIFGIVGCASNIVPQFPLAQYIDDKKSVELHFACSEKIGMTDSCTAGLYIDFEQVHEAFGDFTLTKGGLKKQTKYLIKLPEGKYLFSPYGKGRMGNGAYDKFVSVSGKTCVILNPVEFELNIFARVKNNEGSWVKIDCLEFEKITGDFNQIVLKKPVSFTDKIL
jgi:hypothetical protein